MHSGFAQLDRAAQVIAGAGASNPDRPIAAVQSVGPDGSLRAPASLETAGAVVDIMEATLTYRANAAVLRTSDTMMGALIDLSA